MLTTQHNITAAYMFGGLRLPLGDGETVAKGDRLVGALGPSSAKGYVKAVPELSLPSDLEDLDARLRRKPSIMLRSHGRLTAFESRG